MTLDDYLPDGESFIWTDLSKGVGTRGKPQSVVAIVGWTVGVALTLFVGGVTAALAVTAHWAWVGGFVIGVGICVSVMYVNLSARKDRLAADLDYGLTPTRLIAINRGNGAVGIYFKGGIAAITYDPQSPITIHAPDEEAPYLDLQDVKDSDAAYELISKTLGPTP